MSINGPASRNDMPDSCKSGNFDIETEKNTLTMKILIDNGHGAETAGKRSPDGKLREYKYAREIAVEVVRRLKTLGYDARRIVTEQTDVPLSVRCLRVNDFCRRYGADEVLLVSIHVNAAGRGQWMNARGWSAYTSRGQTQADRLANCLYAAARRHLHGHAIRTDSRDGDPDMEAGFYLLRHTRCPAVLTENFFMDNHEDVAFLLSADGRERVIQTHVDGIVDYLQDSSLQLK